MEFSQDSGSATYRIQSYRQGCIKVSGQEYHQTILIMPELLIAPWQVASFDELTHKDLESLLSYNPQVIIIGTGSQAHHLKTGAAQSLLQHGIGVEIMTSSAACKTYTLLMAEGRHVAAIIFM